VTPAFCAYEITCDISISHFPSFLQMAKAKPELSREKVLGVMRYFDMANFAPMIKCPVLVSNGFTDYCTVPEGIAAMYNNLGDIEKRQFCYPLGFHCVQGPDFIKVKAEWIAKYLLAE